MRHGSNARRGRNNRGGNNNNRRSPSQRVNAFDSNGPDVRIRGNAFQVNEKYVALARDAASAGDHVLAESYLQHAEHYQRVINALAENNEGQQNKKNETAEETSDNESEPAAEGEAQSSGKPRRGNNNRGGRQRYQGKSDKKADAPAAEGTEKTTEKAPESTAESA